MKKIIKTAAYAVLGLTVIGCAKAVQAGPNEANERYFNAWMETNYPGVDPTGLGIYVIEEEEGTGAVVKEDGYAFAEYVISDLEGNISSYTDEETAKQLGTYKPSSYYGPKVLTTIESTIPVGLADAITGMKAGGRKKVIIPSWLMTYTVYDTKEEYLEKASTGANTIYDIRITGFTEDIDKYQIGLIGDYLSENKDLFGGMTAADSLSIGFYYKQLKAPVDTTSFAKDTTIYINYTGRLLDGTVFDTTDEKIAKDNGIYSASRSYEPTRINWGEKVDDITLGSSKSSTIKGFAQTLWQMRAFEKGIGVFYSPLGYGYNGSGSSIPAYAPLTFEIEIVAEPED